MQVHARHSQRQPLACPFADAPLSSPCPFSLPRRPKARVVLVRFCARALLQQLFRRDFLEGASPGGLQLLARCSSVAGKCCKSKPAEQTELRYGVERGTGGLSSTAVFDNSLSLPPTLLCRGALFVRRGS